MLKKAMVGLFVVGTIMGILIVGYRNTQPNLGPATLGQDLEAGAVSWSFPRTDGFTRTPSPPMVHSVTLSNNAINRTAWCYITANVTDPEQGPLELEVTVRCFLPNDSLRVNAMAYDSVQGEWCYNLTTSAQTVTGAWQVQVQASDGTNQTDSSNTTLMITNNPPQILAWHATTSVVIPNLFTANVTPFDVEGIGMVQLNFSGYLYNRSVAPYAFVLDTSALEEGAYAGQIIVTDTDGATIVQAFSVQVQVEKPPYALIILIAIGGVAAGACVAVWLVRRHFRKAVEPGPRERVQQLSDRIETRRQVDEGQIVTLEEDSAAEERDQEIRRLVQEAREFKGEQKYDAAASAYARAAEIATFLAKTYVADTYAQKAKEMLVLSLHYK